MGHFVAVEADMADFRRRDESQNTVYHAEAGPENRDDSQLLSGNHRSETFLNRGFHFHFFQRQVTECFVSHQGCDLLDQGAEFVGSSVFVPQHGDLMLN